MEPLVDQDGDVKTKKRVRRTKAQIAADLEKAKAMGIEPKKSKIYKKIKKDNQTSSTDITALAKIIPQNNSGFIMQTDIPDLIEGKYKTSEGNYIWFIDETEFAFKNTMQVWFLIATDAASRYVTICNVQDRKHNSQDVIRSIEFAIKRNGKPKILHTDKGGCFISYDTQNFLYNQKIRISNASTFGNQVAESNNRVFKEKLFYTLKNLNLNQAKNSFIDLTNLQNVADFVAIMVNDTPAQDLTGKSNQFNTREVIYLALYFFPSTKNLHTFNNSENAELIQQILSHARFQLFNQFNQYKIDQMLFQIEKEVEAAKNKMETAISQQEKNHFELMYTVKQNNLLSLNMQAQTSSFIVEGLINMMGAFNNQNAINQSLLLESNKKIDELQKQINFLHQKAAKAADAEALAELRRQKASQRINKPLRGPILDAEYQVIIKHCKTPTDRVYCTLLYLTGMRISNLAELTFADLEKIKAAKNHVHFRVIKNKIGKISCIYMNPSTRIIIKEIRDDIDIMCEDAKKNSKYKGPDTSIVLIHLKSLNRRINQILKPVSEELKVNIKSHSFRIGIAWRVTDRFGIEIAKQMLNHADIKTTQHYIANDMPHQAASQYVQEIFDPRFQINPETAKQSLQQVKELYDSWNDLDIGPTKKVEKLMSVDDDKQIGSSNNKNVSFEIKENPLKENYDVETIYDESTIEDPLFIADELEKVKQYIVDPLN